ncbi:hypothetical protein ACH9EU_00975 [Kocuria sp. M1R5S2]|uniref:hypothetical protein n=1 Tax=Kocuria rhizosphaerae TaxID=3376285 RepID=UPI0037A3F9FC
MAVVIGEIVTETVVAPLPGPPAAPAAAPPGEIDTEEIVRRATERVLEVLRREWDR